MSTLSAKELLTYLQERGLIADAARAEIAPLDGGVSSEIFVVKHEDGAFVVKQALEKLKVRDDWRCDPVRNLYEQDYMAEAEAMVPGSVPRLLQGDRVLGLFAMEYLDGRWATWKSRLMEGALSAASAARVGELLGRLHAAGWGREDLARRFDNTPLFHELRVAPYLLTTGDRHPELARYFQAEAQRLEATRLTLVHGDYSPKNLMTDGTAVKILDAEVAWYGDPAFDVAFLLNHLLLKAVKFPEWATGLAGLRVSFLNAYRGALGGHWSTELDRCAARLALMLMMARISGKSPVEYIAREGDEARAILRFTLRRVGADLDLAALEEQFQEAFSYENQSR